MAAIQRLSYADLTNLAVEAPDTPMHQAAFAVMADVSVEDVRRHIESRLDQVPEMRRVLRPTRLFEGRPLWVDDADFRIEDHVKEAVLPAPGGEREALRFVEARLGELMDRSRPLWEIWILRGYAEGRVGLLIKLHHALADGPAMVNVVGRLFDLGPDAPSPDPASWRPAPAPSRRALVCDNFSRRIAGLGRAGRHLGHPARLIHSLAVNARGGLETTRSGWDAPRTSLNRPVGPGRRLAALRVSLADVKAIAHAHGCKLNDVFLCVVAGALGLLMRSRGDEVDGTAIRASMAVNLHPTHDAATAGNLIGTVVVPLPVENLEPADRLATIAQATARAKATQRAVVTSGLMVLLAESGITRWYIRRQHLVNVLTTNLPGPPVPLYLAGARLENALAVPPIAGNVTASFAALSYAGTLTLSVVADAASWRDLDVLVDGMRAAWNELRAAGLREGGRTALSA